MDKFDKYINQYMNGEIKYFITNPLFRIKFTHIVGVVILVISALFFTDNIIAISIQLIVALVITAHDFDDRFLKKTLANKIDQLNESQEYISAVLNTNAHAIIAVDSTGLLSIFNKQAEEMFGYTSSEMNTVNDLLKIIPDEYQSQHKIGLENFFTTGKTNALVGQTIELKAMRKDKSMFPMRITIGHKDINNKTLVVANIQNITKEKEQEILIQSAQRHKQMGEMIGNIAHQWRQPLSGITMLASSIKVNNTIGLLEPKDIDTSVDKILGYSVYLSETIEDFRNFYKEDKNLVEFNMFSQIDYSVVLVDELLKDKEVKITKEYSSKILNINGIKNEFTQVIVNIIKNASDALEENKIKNRVILIKVYNDESNCICEIYDNAKGVPEDIKGSIFDPYFTTKHQSQGTGIGLHMSKEIIQSTFKGTLESENKTFMVEKKEYFGACFILKLPKV